MLERRRGALVTIASSAGRQPSQAAAAYAAAKAGVIMLSKHLAAELAPQRIRVNCLAPSAIQSEKMARAMTDEQRCDVAAAFPLGRIGQPDDVAAAAGFLLSDQSSWITGVTLDVSGGRSSSRSAIARDDALANSGRPNGWRACLLDSRRASRKRTGRTVVDVQAPAAADRLAERILDGRPQGQRLYEPRRTANPLGSDDRCLSAVGVRAARDRVGDGAATSSVVLAWPRLAGCSSINDLAPCACAVLHSPCPNLS